MTVDEIAIKTAQIVRPQNPALSWEPEWREANSRMAIAAASGHPAVSLSKRGVPVWAVDAQPLSPYRYDASREMMSRLNDDFLESPPRTYPSGSPYKSATDEAGAVRAIITPRDPASFRIVVSSSMRTGTAVASGVRPLIKQGVRAYRAGRARSNGAGYVWVFVAFHGSCVNVRKSLEPKQAVWKRAAMMGITAADASHRSIAPEAAIPTNAGMGHYIHKPDVAKIIEAVNDLREIWQINFEVDWRAVYCAPRGAWDCLPCQWPQIAIPMPPELIVAPRAAPLPEPMF